MAKWTTIQIQLPVAVLDMGTVLNSLVGSLLAILEVVRTVLNVVKSLMVGLLDPLAAIVETIISEVETLLNDISQLGVYIALDDVNSPYDDIIGGFPAYERRMIKRLVDRTDGTRPAFTANTAVVGVFLYASFDSSSIESAIGFISAIKRFFHIGTRSKPHAIPIGLNAQYGTKSTALGMFGPVAEFLKKGEDPTVAVLRWQMTPPKQNTPSWPVPPPAGFLIEVSTVPDGISLGYITTPMNAAIGDVTSGLIMDPEGKPFKLYGGTDILDVGNLAWALSGNTFTPDTGDGKSRVFGFRTAADTVAIPPNALNFNGKHVLQRTFFLDFQSVMGASLLSPGQPFSLKLNQSDMPYNATFKDAGSGKVQVVLDNERAREVYVRVSAVTKDVKALTGGGQVTTFFWSLPQTSVIAGAQSKAPVTLTFPEGIEAGARGDPSVPLKMTFPSVGTANYLDAVTVSLAILILARADLAAMDPADVAFQLLTNDVAFQPDTAGQLTGLEDYARFLIPQTIGTNTARFFKKASPNPLKFRSKLLRACRESANAMLAVTGILPSELEGTLLGQATVTLSSGVVKPIYQVTWEDLDPNIGSPATILDSLDSSISYGVETSFGIAPNPVSLGTDENLATSNIGSTILLTRSPGFLVPPFRTDTLLPMGQGSADYSPVLYDLGTSQMRFCRNIFLANPSILTAVASVLNISAAQTTYVRKPGEGSWHTYRLFQNGLPPVDAALTDIMGFLKSIKSSITPISEAIVAYIDIINARILELEGLLSRINALLEIMVAIEVPPAAGLVVVGNGTDGVLSQFTSATNKPVDSSPSFARINAAGNTVKAGTYGAGVVLVAGGLPATVADMLKLLFVPTR